MTDARSEAILDFFGCFPNIEDSSLGSLEDLGDGVVLFEALSHISEEYFDSATVARGLGDNWALKSSNLRKLIRNVETYYHEVLHKSADFGSVDVSAVARSSDSEAIVRMVELVVAAAVTCENRAEYVGWIMDLNEDSQAEMKALIESSLSKLSNYDVDESSEDEVDNELVFDSDEEDDSDGFRDPNDMNGLFKGAAESTEILKERDELRSALQDSRRELAAHKSQAAIFTEETESAQKKLRALAEDLQERLQQRQDELMEVEKDYSKVKREQEDTQAKLSEMEEKNALLRDELDVASAKAEQLKKAEATVVAYRRKLEGVGVLSQQMTDLEDQAASYLRQIMDLETETKKVPELQKNIDDLKRQLSKAQQQGEDSTGDVQLKNAEIAKLKDDLRAAESSKKLFEEELQELKSQASIENTLDDATGTIHTLASAQSVSDNKEQMLRLEIENQKLKEQLAASSVEKLGNSDEEEKLKQQIESLKADLKKKEAEKEKLGRDKEKLEAYTKKTLSKFQEKYLVALQECKSKLKEKHDKIEALEMRSVAEKNAQKREERLLSSSIYELGLAIMQQRLKETSTV